MKIHETKGSYKTSFGINWTNSTKKFIKNELPRIIEKEGFDITKQSVQKLVDLKNRKDSITARIFKQNRTSQQYNVFIKDKRINHFIYGKLPLKREIFSELVNNISSDEFLANSKVILDKEAARIKAEPILIRLLDKFGLINLPNKFEDSKDAVEECFSVVDYVDYRGISHFKPAINFSAIKKHLVPNEVIDLIKQLTNKSKNQRNKEEIKEISKIVNKM